MIYVPGVLALRRTLGDAVHACAHITGGGIVGNVARILSSDLDAVIQMDSFTTPEIFFEIQRRGAVDAGEAAGLAHIVVSDNGRGVPAAEAHDIFRRFIRAKTSEAIPGAGLGLNIAESIARMHGMALAVSDNAPGARFVLAERR